MAILAAVGIFIVKPVLETTEKTVDRAGRQIQAQQQASRQAGEDAELLFATSRGRSFVESLQSTWPAAARKVNSCIKRAGDARAMVRCDELGQRLVHAVQSDRSFALSYADTLAAQGDGAGADRVEDRVKRAGFGVAAMQRCHSLADDLLFG